jgi:hypothetical protein
MRVVNVALLVTLFLLISEVSGEVHAYLDPGSGSMAVQILLGALVGGVALVKVYWQRVTAFVLRRRHVEHESLD